MLSRVAVLEVFLAVGKLKGLAAPHGLCRTLAFPQAGEITKIPFTMATRTMRRETRGKLDLESAIEIALPVPRHVRASALHVVDGLVGALIGLQGGQIANRFPQGWILHGSRARVRPMGK